MEDLEDLIPHQLKLSMPQVGKLLQGLMTHIPHKHLGAHKGEHIIHLLPANAEKMLTAYKSGKGAKVKMNKKEIAATLLHGRGIEDIFNSPIAQKVVDKLIDKGLDYALGGRVRGGDLASDILSGMQKVAENPIAQKVAEKALDKLLGGKVAKGSDAAKERMAKLRAMRGKGKKGAGEFEDFFGKIGNAFTQTWNQAPRSDTERQAANFVNENLIGSVPKIVGKLAGSDAEEIARMPIGAYLDERRRVDSQGAGIVNSKAYKQTMKGKVGFAPSTVVKNKPASAFAKDPRVKPAGDQMTLSPYQLPSAPAMNPFVPKYYTQEGGTQCGYGGRGLPKGSGFF